MTALTLALGIAGVILGIVTCLIPDPRLAAAGVICVSLAVVLPHV